MRGEGFVAIEPQKPRVSVDEGPPMWVFQVESTVQQKIDDAAKKPKVAFLSSCSRKYSPESPGHSRFALANMYVIEDTKNPSPSPYKPKDESLNKPVSKLGYGIGGLSGPRFTHSGNDDFPAPNEYQRLTNSSKNHLFPPNVWIKLGLMEGKNIKQYLKQARQNHGGTSRHSLDNDNSSNDEERSQRTSKELSTLWHQCHQVDVAFGRSTKQSRFEETPKWSTVGPGHYNIRSMTPKHVPLYNSFLRGPTSLNPLTKLHCDYGPKQSCVECGETLMKSVDYYRSRFHVTLPPMLSDFVGNTRTTTTVAPKFAKPERVLLCRSCYCKALRGESRYWKRRSQVEWLFEKTRHCSYIHEHNGLPEYTEKASCYWTHKLARKETILNLRWPDKCERRMKEKRHHHH